MIEELEPVEPVQDPSTARAGGEDHPMRVVTRAVAFDPDAWSPEMQADVAELFDRLADEWHTRDTPGRAAPLLDALRRGDVGRGRCLEVGAGTGIATRDLRSVFDVIALDLSPAMVDLFPREHGAPVVGDASRLPLRDDSVDAVALQNALLFPAEVDRVLCPGGVVIWVNSRGEFTPIHLPPADVAAALPGSWVGSWSRAGEGTWCVLRRAADAS